MKKTILIIASNPKGTSFLRLDRELRIITEVIQKSALRHTIDVQTTWAARTTDLLASLKQHKPWIVHFCGHGEGSAGLVLENDAGKRTHLSSAALTEISSLFDTCIEGILLNACYSQVQAAQMSAHINYVIGMSRAIADKAALAFTRGFYTAVCDGEPIPNAFKFGKSQISIEYPNSGAKSLTTQNPTAATSPSTPASHTPPRNLTPQLFQKETLTTFDRTWAQPASVAEAANTSAAETDKQSTAQHGQHQSNTVSGITFGTGNATFNFSPVQAQNSNINLSIGGKPETTDTDDDVSVAAFLNMIEQLSQTVSNDLDMNPLLKQGALSQIEQIASALEKSPLDDRYLQKMIVDLDQGLKGSPASSAAMGAVTRLFHRIQREGYDA